MKKYSKHLVTKQTKMVSLGGLQCTPTFVGYRIIVRRVCREAAHGYTTDISCIWFLSMVPRYLVNGKTQRVKGKK